MVAGRQRIFVYEFITGGGLLREDSVPAGSLLEEGQTMLEAVTQDLARLANVEVITRLDHRLAEGIALPCQVDIANSASTENEEFCMTAASADWTLLIAPEFDSILFDRATAVVDRGGKLLGAAPAYIQLAADKLAVAQTLQAAQIPTPTTLPLSSDLSPIAGCGDGFVVKPRDGAGSTHVTFHHAVEEALHRSHPERYCIQPWVPGLPCSVLLLCSEEEVVSLKATEQRLTSDGKFTYLGGEVPLPTHFDTRARRLAEAAAIALGEPSGFIGVDMVLSPSGEHDVVIEVNPRLTTSYVGLRCLTDDNLVAKLMAVMEGNRATIDWHDRTVRFDSHGDTFLETDASQGAGTEQRPPRFDGNAN